MQNKKHKKVSHCMQAFIAVLLLTLLSGCSAVKTYQQNIVQQRQDTFSQLGVMVQLTRNIAAAQEKFYDANYRYAGKIAELDVQLPADTCQRLEHEIYDLTDSGDLLSCQNDFLIDNMATSGAVTLNYCPGAADSWEKCKDARVVRIDYNLRYNDLQPNMHWCTVFNSSYPYPPSAHEICAKLPGFAKRIAETKKP